MSKQSTEPTGEQFSASPELGFAFGRVSLNKIVDFLCIPELRGDREAEDIGLYVSLIGDYFKDGPQLMLWQSYLEAEKQAQSAFRDQWLSQEVAEKYAEISEMIYGDHIEAIRDEKETINTFLAQYPGVITKDAEGIYKLTAVDSIQRDLSTEQLYKKVSPVQQVASWNNDLQTDIESDDGHLYVNMTALPKRFSEELNRYRTLYAVDLGEESK